MDAPDRNSLVKHLSYKIPCCTGDFTIHILVFIGSVRVCLSVGEFAELRYSVTRAFEWSS